LTHAPGTVFNSVTDEREDVLLCLVVDPADLQSLREGREGGREEGVSGLHRHVPK